MNKTIIAFSRERSVVIAILRLINPLEYEFSADQAVRLWRVLLGDLQEIVAETQHHGEVELKWDESETWTLSCGGEKLVSLNADEALALAWAIEASVEDALTQQFVLQDHDSVEKKMSIRNGDKVHIDLSNVWVLSWRGMLTGDAAVDGAEAIGGGEQVYSSQEKAMDSLREFLRPLVNGANTETNWESSEKDVDTVLDQILADVQDVDGQKVWTYNGSKQSISVYLTKRDVDVTL